MPGRDDILKMMLEKQITEIHMVPGSPIMTRDNIGELTSLGGEALTTNDTKNFVAELLNSDQRAEFMAKHEINIALSIPGVSRYRFNIFMQRNSISVVGKTYPTKVPSFEELNLSQKMPEFCDKMESGLMIVTGSRGSGKSHTVAAIIEYFLETKQKKIVTMENPIRFLFKNKKGIICQRESSIDVKDYINALNNIHNLNGDIYLIDEIYSYQEMNKVLQLATGGSIVVLKAVAPYLSVLLESLTNLYPNELQDQFKNMLSMAIETSFSQVLCKNTAGDKLLPAQEIFISTPNMRNLVKEGKFGQLYQIMGAAGREMGMVTQEFSLRSLLKKGSISQEEAYTRTVRPDDLKKVLSIPF